MSEETQVVEQEIAVPVVEGEIASESASGDQQESQVEGEQKPKGGFQKRIDKLTRKAGELEQEKEYWRQQALRTAPPATATATEPKVEGKPTADKFSTQAEFLEALADWKVDQRLAASEAARISEQVKNRQATVVQGFTAKEDAFRQAAPDYDDVMADADDIHVSNALLAEIVENDHGPALKYFLAKNPDEAKRLSALEPKALAREVGRIESRFTTSQAAEPVRTTGAPKPPTPTSRSTPTSTKAPGEMEPAEYRAWRAKQK